VIALFAHAGGLIGRSDLPIPEWLFGWAAAMVLICSFVALAVLWPSPRLEEPRERRVLPGPSACPCCGGKLAKLGETITETLEVIPRQWKVIQTVREKLTCRACETITQPPAPFHPIARGRAGPNLLAMIVEAKFGQHIPLNRQSETFAREGIELDVSTLADWVGACTAALAPLTELIRLHVMAAERLHGDDTTVPVWAKGKTITGRLWTSARRPPVRRTGAGGGDLLLLA